MTPRVQQPRRQRFVQDFSNLADIGEGLLVIAAARAFVEAQAAARGGAARLLLLLTTVENSAFEKRDEALDWFFRQAGNGDHPAAGS